MRKLSPKNQASYIRVMKRLAKFLGCSPDTGNAEDLRPLSVALGRFLHFGDFLEREPHRPECLFETTLDQPELMAKMRAVHEPRKLPEVLSREEVACLLAALDDLKHKTALSVAYGAGLRSSEVVSLKINDGDSQRMTCVPFLESARHV